MIKLSNANFERAKNWILEHGRDLEKVRVKCLTEDGHQHEIIAALSGYQNQDGGFGKGLEADIRLPHSSSIATTIALQVLVEFDNYPQAKQMIDKAIRYFENHFNSERQGWYAVPPEVNEYPHAFWWTVHEDGMSWIDHHWGNPSAEIIGYLRRYHSEVTQLDVDQLVQQCIDYFLSLTTFESEHEIYCYQRFFQLHPDLLTNTVTEQLEKAVQSLVVLDKERWKNYVPFPLKFIPDLESTQFGIPKKKIDDNLAFFIQALEKSPFIEPPWDWNTYMDSWGQAKQEWRGVLTYEALKLLLNYRKVVS
ncbi:hypothetical protein MUO14_09715 [Halobacillus shinanisalinarum]|uniref:Uncharacterized protein n=1 Tax=Halobacillus shinanisalinarum TaxID=2932258 RepID=A0ABY4H3Y5_9BACI|nr:hypothetical protein [Halobacillus shinanisalinarum]UOQ95171.1 hypothetical protein MUO14_09715 [Halobacillus shinanisalinarum]